MEIKITTKHLLKMLLVVSWILFIGLCVEAGGVIFNIVYTLFFNPNEAITFWNEADLSSLYQYDHGYFLVITGFMSVTTVMKALIFYLIVKILHEKKLDMVQPFSETMGRFIFNLSYLTFGIGLFSWWGIKYAMWLVTLGVKMPEIQHLLFDGANVWLFTSVTLFVIALVFKRGVEIQAEHELTV